MGYSSTESSSTPAKTRVWDFSFSPGMCVGVLPVQAVETHQETHVTVAVNVSGHGRFLSKDPIAESGGKNLYAFVGNDPVNNWDYLGMVVNAGGIKSGRYTYTCICGWLDDDHLTAYGDMYKAIRTVYGMSPSYIFGYKLRAPGPPRDRMSFWDNAGSGDHIGTMKLLYQVGSAEEASSKGGTQYGFEDLASDVVGGLAGKLQYQGMSESSALDEVKKRCFDVGKTESLRLFQEMSKTGLFGTKQYDAVQFDNDISSAMPFYIDWEEVKEFVSDPAEIVDRILSEDPRVKGQERTRLWGWGDFYYIKNTTP